ncbi:acetyltransferase, gnat family [Dactylonectria macrodidyma]|uniref:Acetyltransferase, gnat family n=1 Tax=Dactylonectria macrodidyma TaxID=307937 RepID=A0A9P9DQD0_9HYPO|nr:acetyltransferase, gnat family [Dactylonectria macrodidyma]
MESKPASDLSLAEIAELVNRSFSNGIWGEVNYSAEEIGVWFKRNFTSLELSHIYYLPSDLETPVAFAFISTREDKPTEVRIAPMGVVPSFRRQGLGIKAMNALIEAEKKRGTTLLELECAQKNTAALNLYKSVGFFASQELCTWEGTSPEADNSSSASTLGECEMAEVEQLVKLHAADDLPWPAWGFNAPPTKGRAFTQGHAYCCIADPDDAKPDAAVELLTLFVEPEWRGKGEAKALLKEIMAKYPGKKWVASGPFPKQYGEKLVAEMGFKEVDSARYQMRLAL